MMYVGTCFAVMNGCQRVKEKTNYKKPYVPAVTKISHFPHHLYYFKIILNDKLSTIICGFQLVLQKKQYLCLLAWKDFLYVCLFSS